MSQYLRIIGRGFRRETTLLLGFCKIFGKLVNNRLVDYLEKFCVFSDYQFGFMTFQSTAYRQAVVFDKITSAFNRPGAT